MLHQENANKILEHMNLGNSEYLLLLNQILQQLYKHKGETEKENEISLKFSLFKHLELSVKRT